MHIIYAVASGAAVYAAMYGVDRWDGRPSAQARYAALNLREKIAYHVRRRRIASAVQAGILALSASLYAAGIVSFGTWLVYAIISGFYLVVNLYRLYGALAARRTYRDLGPMAYLAEVQHYFK